LCVTLALSVTAARVEESLSDQKRLEVLKDEVAHIAPLAKGDVAASIKPIGGEPTPLLNGDRMSSMASVFKLSVALKTLHDVESGKHGLDDLVELLPEDYSLHAILDVHLPFPGSKISYRNLIWTMIVDSDNTAADALMREAGGPKAVEDYIHSLGVTDIRIDRHTKELGYQHFDAKNMEELNAKFTEAGKDPYTMEAFWTGPSEAFEADPRDRATPNAIVVLVDKLVRGQILDEELTEFLTSTMEKTTTGLKRLRGMLPPGTVVGDKTGTIGGTTNDVGFIELPDGRKFAIAVFINSSRAPMEPREQTIAQIARSAYDYLLFQ
jgi:beta-lactamase class A